MNVKLTCNVSKNWRVVSIGTPLKGQRYIQYPLSDSVLTADSDKRFVAIIVEPVDKGVKLVYEMSKSDSHWNRLVDLHNVKPIEKVSSGQVYQGNEYDLIKCEREKFGGEIEEVMFLGYWNNGPKTEGDDNEKE